MWGICTPTGKAELTRWSGSQANYLAGMHANLTPTELVRQFCEAWAAGDGS